MMTLQEIITELVFEVMDYSGRGMGGDKCLGVRIDCEPYFFIAQVFEYILNMEVDFEQKEEMLWDLQSAISNMKYDSLGLGLVVYFPRIKFI